MNKKAPKPNYDYSMQKLYLEMFLSDAETFIRCQNIFDPLNFDQRLQDSAEFINKYVDALENSGIDNNKLKNMLKELYVEALNLEQA